MTRWTRTGRLGARARVLLGLCTRERQWERAIYAAALCHGRVQCVALWHPTLLISDLQSGLARTVSDLAKLEADRSKVDAD